MEEIRVLQLGGTDWNTVYAIPENVELSHYDYFVESPKKPYDVVFLDKTPFHDEYQALMKATNAYTLFVTENARMTDELAHFMKYRVGQGIQEDEIQNFFLYEIGDYFPGWYGEKYGFNTLEISRNFKGIANWNGNHDVELMGQFGDDFQQMVFWKLTPPFMLNQTLDFWLEYEKEGDCELLLRIFLLRSGDTTGGIIKEWNITEQELFDVVQIQNTVSDGYFFASLEIKGDGRLRLMGLHSRKSRRNKGYFLPGGERKVSSKREEAFFYFDPGNMKPPLNVYFSGYKTKEGFEGYNMMRKMGCPFLLVAEARLEGGGFYMGSEEYEQMIYHTIESYMLKLGFTADQVIMSGLSMGTFGAMYYGCDLKPHAIIVGKPLASIGDVAANETLNRPGGFPTSLDVLMSLYHGTDEKAIEALNRRFWEKFDTTNWRDTKFVVSYMIEDDYDSNAYKNMVSGLTDPGVQIYGKGIHGRHNDNTYGIVNWFKMQYEKILEMDFGRKAEK